MEGSEKEDGCEGASDAHSDVQQSSALMEWTTQHLLS
jgi:hypothetical protein